MKTRLRYVLTNDVCVVVLRAWLYIGERSPYDTWGRVIPSRAGLAGLSWPGKPGWQRGTGS